MVNITTSILTKEINFGIVVKVSNVKFNKRKKCFTFDTEIISNPYNKEINKDAIQKEIFELILESLTNKD